MPLTAPPTAPSTSDPTTFATRADALVAWHATNVTELGALQTDVAAKQTTASAAAVTAAADAVAAAASAAAAATSAGAAIWVSGTTYAIGDVRYSPVNQRIYRRTTTGAGTTDPSADPTNWAVVDGGNPTWVIKTANYTAVAGEALMCNTTAGAFTITLPATPTASHVVRIADYAGTFATYNLTVGRNALKIMGLSEDMTISTNNTSITLTYIDSTQGWRLT